MQVDKTNLAWNIQCTIPTVPIESRRILDAILVELRNQGWGDHDIFCIHLALEEALMNAIKHGNKLDPRKQIDVTCRITQTTLTATVKDEGVGFDPATVPDCNDDDRLEIPSGRGLKLMRSFMNRVAYNEAGNSVTLEKVRSQAPVAVAG